ncbi:hypothetical protein FHW17_004754, partial [Phyllobacterium sp. P30BS-XVII]|nr:hypothetical protein [Phyllobacterium sp. P30BS-XVII]
MSDDIEEPSAGSGQKLRRAQEITQSVKLSPVAYQIASQYARTSNSPVMISGIMRIVEFL